MPAPAQRAAPSEPRARLAYWLGGVGVVCLAAGSYRGLFVAPPEVFMGDVQRIMYVHVPTAWVAMLVFTFAFVCALGFLLRARWQWDCYLEASIEVGVVMGALLCLQGSIWAKPTWGVWWAWDPRLSTMAILMFSFVGILALRGFAEDPGRRAVWSSAATIIAAVDVPIVYFSVKWWNSLHQTQSSPATVSPQFYWPLRINAIGLLLLAGAMVLLRERLAELRLERQLAPPPAARERAGGPAPSAAAVGGALSGTIHGGWRFVWLAYGASAAIWLLYALSLHHRFRAEVARTRRLLTEEGGGIPT
jgi:heme exporter protein C